MSIPTEPGQVQELPTDLVVARYAQLAARIIARRRARRRLLPQGMLVDVAWDVLLHLLAHRAAPARLTSEAIAVETELSPTVAVRWLSLLQADGLVHFRERSEVPGWELSATFLLRLIAYLRDNYRDE